MSTMNKTTENTISLWNIGTEFDEIHTQLNHILNMINVFEEQLDGEVDFLKKSDDGFAYHFVQRYDMIQSMLFIIQTYTYDTLRDMRIQIDAVYEADKKINPRIKE